MAELYIYVAESWKISLADRSAGHEHQAAGNRNQKRAGVHYTYISGAKSPELKGRLLRMRM